MALRKAVVQHIRTITDLLLRGHIASQYTNIDSFITGTRMDCEDIQGSDIEIFTVVCYLLNVWNLLGNGYWAMAQVQYMYCGYDLALGECDYNEMALYINNPCDYFEW